MNLPPFVFSRAFWQGVSFVVAGILAILAMVGLIPVEWMFTADAVLAFFLGILHLVGIDPTVRRSLVGKLAFWRGVAFVIAGVSVILGVLGVIPMEWVLAVDTVLAFIIGILHLFGIDPQVRHQ